MSQRFPAMSFNVHRKSIASRPNWASGSSSFCIHIPNCRITLGGRAKPNLRDSWRRLASGFNHCVAKVPKTFHGELCLVRDPCLSQEGGNFVPSILLFCRCQIHDHSISVHHTIDGGLHDHSNLPIFPASNLRAEQKFRTCHGVVKLGLLKLTGHLPVIASRDGPIGDCLADWYESSSSNCVSNP